MATVCDSCLTVAYDHGIKGRTAQATMMVELGADVEDHLCDELEDPGCCGECHCGCHPDAKRKLRPEIARV